jgi:hypothetical protein
MSKIRGKRPSPALVISVLALFVALGGSAYAAKKIGTKEIKANAVTTGKIKKNAVTTSKIKKEAVTGAKIKESSLGPVPNATHATNADNSTNAVNATNFSRYFTSGIVKVSVGQTASLGTIGPFSFFVRCIDLGAGDFEVESFATTSQAGSNISSEEEEYYESDFDPGEESEVGYSDSSTSSLVTNYGYGGYYSGFYAASADGKTLLSGEVNNAVHTYGSDCAAWMFALNAG